MWAHRFGSNSDDRGRAIALDSTGNVYVSGGFEHTVNFDPNGNMPLTSDWVDGFFIKLDSTGNPVWARSVGGPGWDESHGLAVDEQNAVYITGQFEHTADFNPSATSYNLTSAGSLDAFISKFDASGNLVWAKRVGGSSYDNSFAIALSENGTVHTTGVFTYGADFDPGNQQFVVTATNDSSFILMLDSQGNFLRAKRVAEGHGYGIAVDSLQNIYLTGSYRGPVDFDSGPGVTALDGHGLDDAFVCKFDASWNLTWVRGFGDAGYDYGLGIDLDDSSNVYVTGNFRGTVHFDSDLPDASLTSFGHNDSFVLKLNSAGEFIWARQQGGTDYDEGKALAVQPSGIVHATGFFSGVADFDPSEDVYPLTSFGGTDIFLSILADNRTPIANAGGPYLVFEGDATALSAAGSSDPDNDALSHSWDLDGDGQFGETGALATRGDEIGVSPVFSAAGLDGPTSWTIFLRVTDADGQVDEAEARISIINAAPSVLLAGHAIIDEDESYSLLILAINDPGIENVTSYRIGWGDGFVELFEGNPAGLAVAHVYSQGNTDQTITIDLIDDDGTHSDVGSKQVHVNAPPTLIGMPTDITVEANAPGGALVAWAEPQAVDAEDGSLAFSRSHNPGDLFPIGVTTVSYTTTDPAGSSHTASFTVKVTDTAPPAFASVPNDIIVYTTGTFAPVAWAPPIATDAVSWISLTSSHDPGDQFTLGETIVSYQATDALGNSSEAQFRVLVVPGGRFRFTDSDGDLYSVHLAGRGDMAVTLDDPDGNGHGPISRIDIRNTDPSRSSLTIAVQKRIGGDALVAIGTIAGSGLKWLRAGASDLVGSGIQVGSLGSLIIHDIRQGASVMVGGTPSQTTMLTANVIEANSEVSFGSSISTFTAAVVGDASISAPALANLRIKGRFNADLTLTGSGNPRKPVALGYAVIGGDVREAIWTIDGDVRSLAIKGIVEDWHLRLQGDLGTARFGAVSRAALDVDGSVRSLAAATFHDSHLHAGFTPTDLADPLAGGEFQPGTVIGLFQLSAAFSNSTVAASRIGRVAIRSLQSDDDGKLFGILADESILGVRVTMPAFRFDPNDLGPQGIEDFVVVLA